MAPVGLIWVDGVLMWLVRVLVCLLFGRLAACLLVWLFVCLLVCARVCVCVCGYAVALVSSKVGSTLVSQRLEQGPV